MERLTKRWESQPYPNLAGKVICEYKECDSTKSCENCIHGRYKDRLAAIEDILGDEYNLEKLRLFLENDKSCYTCKNYKGDKICGFKSLNVDINPQERCSVREGGTTEEGGSVMFDYDKESKYAAEILNKYDFSSLLENCYGIDVYDIKDELELYGTEVAKALENLTIDELIEYLHQRYEMRIEEVPTYYIWWNNKRQNK